MIHDHPTEPYIDEDLEAHRAQQEIGDNALRVIGYCAAAFLFGILCALPWALRMLDHNP